MPKRIPFAGVLIDYGYGAPALGDTFQAISDHISSPIPLKDPRSCRCDGPCGFSQLIGKAAAKRGPCGWSQLATQREFSDCPWGAGARRAIDAGARKYDFGATVSSADLQRLVDHDKMGDLFKVVGLAGAQISPNCPVLKRLKPKAQKTKREGT